MAESKGNLQKSQNKAQAPTWPKHDAYWSAVLYRFLSIPLILILLKLLVTGKGFVAGRGGGIPVSLHDNALLFFFALAYYLYFIAMCWFFIPYHRWVFTLRLPDPPPPEPADTWQPKRKLVLPSWSDLVEPAFLKSALLLICVFGLMAALCGAVQGVMGEVYVPVGDGLEVYTLRDDPLGFLKALIPYGVIGLGTLILGTVAYLWHPVKNAAGVKS